MLERAWVEAQIALVSQASITASEGMQTIPLPFVALIAAVERLTETHRKLEGLMHSAGPRDRQTQVAAQDLADGVRAVCHEMAAIKAKQAAFDA